MSSIKNIESENMGKNIQEEKKCKKKIEEAIKKDDKLGQLLKLLVERYLGKEAKLREGEYLNVHEVQQIDLKKFKGLPQCKIIIDFYFVFEEFIGIRLYTRIKVRNWWLEHDLYRNATVVLNYDEHEKIDYIDIFHLADNIIFLLNELKNLKIDRLSYYHQKLFSIRSEEEDTLYSLVDDFEDIEVADEKCCVCYNYTRTKVACCKAYVCKVCLINIAHNKNKDIDHGYTLPCPHCRKDNKSDAENWRFDGDGTEEYDEDEDEEEEEDD